MAIYMIGGARLTAGTTISTANNGAYDTSPRAVSDGTFQLEYKTYNNANLTATGHHTDDPHVDESTVHFEGV